ncbi:MAG: archease [Candidatus Zixiibacteriota bacterium]
MGKFRFLEDVAIADVAFLAEGKTLEELFATCARATFEVMANTKKVEPKEVLKIELKHNELDKLLFDWLAELIYLKDAKEMFFGKFDLKIEKKNKYILSGQVFGEKIDYKKHKVKVDVKAVTLHLFEVKKLRNNWRAKVVLDI